VGDLTLYVEEYATAEKSQRAFDTELANSGMFPLLILVENTGQHSYEVNTQDIVVRGNTLLKTLAPEEAAIRAQRNAVGRALGWSLVVPIISIPFVAASSAFHTSGVNQQIIQDFLDKSFLDGIVTSNQERSGFVFFELDEGRKDLAGLTLEMTARNAASGEQIKIIVPLPAVTLQ
jgi:hypothetical protein